MKMNQLIHVKRFKTSKEIWDQLINRFQTTNVVVKNFFTKKFYNLKMAKNEQVQTYFNQFCQVLDELTNARAKVPNNETTTAFLGPCQGHLQV
jgi:hypothetical protein